LATGVGGGLFSPATRRARLAIAGEHGIVERGLFFRGRRDGAAGLGHVDDDVDVGVVGFAEAEEAGVERSGGGEGEGRESGDGAKGKPGGGLAYDEDVRGGARFRVRAYGFADRGNVGLRPRTGKPQ